MNVQKNLTVGLAVVALSVTALAATQFAAARIPGTPASFTNSIASQQTGWEYGRLLIVGDLVSWQGGGSSNQIQTLPLETQYRRLGGNSLASVTNLLNLIGEDGWELVATDETNWTFKRAR